MIGEGACSHIRWAVPTDKGVVLLLSSIFVPNRRPAGSRALALITAIALSTLALVGNGMFAANRAHADEVVSTVAVDPALMA